MNNRQQEVLQNLKNPEKAQRKITPPLPHQKLLFETLIKPIVIKNDVKAKAVLAVFAPPIRELAPSMYVINSIKSKQSLTNVDKSGDLQTPNSKESSPTNIQSADDVIEINVPRKMPVKEIVVRTLTPVAILPSILYVPQMFLNWEQTGYKVAKSELLSPKFWIKMFPFMTNGLGRAYANGCMKATLTAKRESIHNKINGISEQINPLTGEIESKPHLQELKENANTAAFLAFSDSAITEINRKKITRCHYKLEKPKLSGKNLLETLKRYGKFGAAGYPYPLIGSFLISTGFLTADYLKKPINNTLGTKDNVLVNGAVFCMSGITFNIGNNAVHGLHSRLTIQINPKTLEAPSSWKVFKDTIKNDGAKGLTKGLKKSTLITMGVFGGFSVIEKGLDLNYGPKVEKVKVPLSTLFPSEPSQQEKEARIIENQIRKSQPF